MGLTDVGKPAEVKIGAAELAAALSDAIEAIKNAPPAYRQMVEEHKALKATKAEHQAILDKNEQILSDHRTSRATWAEEQRKAKIADEKLDKEFSDREKEIQRQQNAITAREDAVKRREKMATDLSANLEQKTAALMAQDHALALRESALSSGLQKLEAERNDVRATQDELASVLARRKA